MSGDDDVLRRTSEVRIQLRSLSPSSSAFKRKSNVEASAWPNVRGGGGVMIVMRGALEDCLGRIWLNGKLVGRARKSFGKTLEGCEAPLAAGMSIKSILPQPLAFRWILAF